MKFVSLEKSLPKSRKRLGEILIEAGLIDEDILKNALEVQKIQKKMLGQVLVDMAAVNETQLAEVLSKQLGIQYFRLSNVTIQKEAVAAISKEMAEKYSIIPLQVKDNKLIVATSNPLNYNAIEDIQFAVSKPVFVGLSTVSDILSAINTYYPNKDLKKDIITQAEMDAKMEVIQQIEVKEKSDQELATIADLPPVVKLTNAIIADAMNRRASDIHIEPQIDEKGKPNLIVRCRVDGIMYEALRTDRHVHPSLVSRIKIMSGLDISERRKPQDGKAQVKYENTKYDLRVSTIPTTYGEKITIRILNPASSSMGLEELGFGDNDLTNILNAISRPQGILLVTGPTGSGKSSTLVACLNRLNTPQVNIITVEDPVEFDVAGINQVQINTKAGVTFAAGLRSILRQDPDIVMVGEIRDAETAEVSFQAAQTGHLVLSTLHTNDAPSTLTRLLDLGVDGFQISAALMGVVGQRLIRRIHTDCKVQDEVNPSILERIGRFLRDQKQPAFWKGAGCDTCQNTGYSGRMGIYETLMMTPSLRDLIKPGAQPNELKNAAFKEGFRTMTEDGIEKALKGLTTVEEVFRVVPPEMEAGVQKKSTSKLSDKSPILHDITEQSTDAKQDLSIGTLKNKSAPALTDEAIVTQRDQPHKILVVDDSEIDRAIICDALETQNYVTNTAEDGIEALQKIKKEIPSLVVIDYMMPRMDGKTLIKKLKADTVTRSIPLLMLTSIDDVESEVSLIKAGADDYITKPVNRDKFLIRVENLLRRLA